MPCLDCLVYPLKGIVLVEVVFLDERLDLHLFVLLLGARSAGPIRLSLVSFSDTASDRSRCLRVSFLVFVENVTRTPEPPRLPDARPHQFNGFLDLSAKIQEVDSVIAVLFHPTADITA